MIENMVYEDFKKIYKLHLDAQQEEAVQTIEGPILLLAVPGSGKTTVLISRLAYMIMVRDINPKNILTMTYTNAAPKDMGERFCKMFGKDFAKNLKFITINSLCFSIIKSYNTNNSFSIPSEKELFRILKNICLRYTSENIFITDTDIKDIKRVISYIKNMEINDKDEIINLYLNNEYIYEIYNEYNKYLINNRLMDFDDQLVYAKKILKKHSNILTEYQEKYKYICVDEAQDTSKIQHEIIRMLVGKNNNIFMVGDEDQSIYGFRAAYPEALLRFKENYKNAKVLLMETNYRSTKEIVNASNSFIKRNIDRYDKNMITNNPNGEKITIYNVNSVLDQYLKVLSIAVKETETAILYRNNETAIALISILMDWKIESYYVKELESSFFTDKIVVDIIDIFKFANDLTNTESFKNIYYKINFYIEREMMEDIVYYSRKYNADIFDSIYNGIHMNESRKKELLRKKALLLKLNKLPIQNGIDFILQELGYIKYIEKNNKKVTDNTYISKINTLKIIGKDCNNINEFINKLKKLENRVIQGNKNENANIILSTIHSSKGLEYDKVHIIDVFDNVLPSIDCSNIDNKKEYYEERRLFYVAMTRAKKKLNLYNVTDKKCSFIEEIDSIINNKTHINTIDEEIYNNQNYIFTIGENVYHEKFGEGKVIKVDAKIVTVKFKNVKYGEKNIIISMGKIKKMVRKIKNSYTQNRLYSKC